MRTNPVPAIAAVLVMAHLVTAGNYGIFRDEYYYLACARHLAWGYVDHPPLSIAVLAAVRAVFGEGIWTLRVVPALCAGALVMLVPRIAARFGGGGFAQALAATAVAVVGVVQVTTGFYSMNALDLVFWTGARGRSKTASRSGSPASRPAPGPSCAALSGPSSDPWWRDQGPAVAMRRTQGRRVTERGGGPRLVHSVLQSPPRRAAPVALRRRAADRKTLWID